MQNNQGKIIGDQLPTKKFNESKDNYILYMCTHLLLTFCSCGDMILWEGLHTGLCLRALNVGTINTVAARNVRVSSPKLLITSMPAASSVTWALTTPDHLFEFRHSLKKFLRCHNELEINRGE